MTQAQVVQISVLIGGKALILWLGGFTLLVLLPPAIYATQSQYIFCHHCYDQTSELITDRLGSDDQKVVNALIAFEQGLNVNSHKRSRVPFKIIGAGSTSLGLSISTLPDMLVRRLPGFYSFDDAVSHIQLIQEYRVKLHKLGIATTDTQLVAIETSPQTALHWLLGGPGVVYVIQPLLQGNQLAKNYLQNASKSELREFFGKQFAVAEKILTHNQSNPGNEVSVDIVMNNWELNFTTEGHYSLRLNDIAQPLFVVDGTEPYGWYDQAASILYPVIGMTQTELQKQFKKLLHPRELLIQLLWGYESLHSPLVSHSLNVFSNATSPLFNTCEPTATYPQWVMQAVNKKLVELNELNEMNEMNGMQEMRLKELSTGEVYEAFKNNNYAIECFRLLRELTASVRYSFSYLKYTNLMALFFGPSNIYLTRPHNTKVDMYQTEMRPGYMQCLRNPDNPY